MANKHLGHIDFKRSDIIKNNLVLNVNLDILCKQILDVSAYDKLGTWFYKIDKSMSFSGSNRTYDFVKEWLDYMEDTTPNVAASAGYIG